jgi:hypothetical protein
MSTSLRRLAKIEAALALQRRRVGLFLPTDPAWSLQDIEASAGDLVAKGRGRKSATRTPDRQPWKKSSSHYLSPSRKTNEDILSRHRRGLMSNIIHLAKQRLIQAEKRLAEFDKQRHRDPEVRCLAITYAEASRHLAWTLQHKD